MIGLSSARVKERLADGDVVVVQVFKEPLLARGHLGVLGISLRDEVVVGLITCGGVLFGQVAQLLSGSARACYPYIKEVEGVRQQEEQEVKRDEEVRDEVKGEVEEVRRDAQHTHETWVSRWCEQDSNLSHGVRASIKEDT